MQIGQQKFHRNLNPSWNMAFNEVDHNNNNNLECI